MCSVSTAQQPPFDVQFTFRVAGAGPVYVRKGCVDIEYGVSSCASGYSRQLGPTSSVGTCECGVLPCAPAVGGPCEPPAAVALSTGTTAETAWRATSVEFEWTGTTQCSRLGVLPAGKYRVAVRAYETPEDAERGVRGWVVTRDFELPAPGGVVDVPIGARAAEPCEAAATATVPTCTGHEARETACNLPTTISFSNAGGELASYYETYGAAPPATFSAARTANTPGIVVPAPCATAIPRCSGDARVVTTSDVTRVLSEPSIAAAFATPATVFGGTAGFNYRLEVQRADGTGISIGSPCVPPDGCTRALTPAAFDVQMALRTLYWQRVADGCVDFYPD
jgi:hypothetical protein